MAAGVEDISLKKRVRSCNWDEEEKRLLRILVLERIDVIENKDTSTNTNTKKKASWQEILSCFNSLNKKKRDLKELTTQWRNTKGKVKSRESEYKRAKLMTGGGPPPPSPPPEDLAIIQATPNECIVDSNQFDSDSVHITKIHESLTSGNINLSPIDDPWTPMPGTSNQLKETKQISEDVGQPETNKGILCSASNRVHNTFSKKKCIPKKNKNNVENYERELFLLVKKSREREYERAEEIHKKKMSILDLEYEYWKKKINKIE
ncbi:myb/SANT-like DNA-binding domain-containing protein 3 [Helicoverpa zea]|uniref:myb/SANT-like DNA-binding domain-containing protein 3 n=1 Tax=Helicoverpa zea TaxID=7113 RepID=UPI001F55C781|nr:myb/SANT-like DNA-binding domain-containing protein 3 [Helicoverpa zea]